MPKVCLLLLIASTIGCDQVSKHFATTHLLGAARKTFLADTVRLEYAENTGAFLSLGSDLPLWLRTVLFTAGTGLILAFSVVAVYRSHSSALPQIGLALLLGGGISNLADRIRHGAVVDFLNVGIGSVRTGIFNVADMVILLGVTLLLVGRSKKRRTAGG